MNTTATSVKPVFAPRTSQGRPLRRVGAVLAGFVTIVVVSTGVDAILHATGVYPPFGQVMSHPLFALATAYRFVIGIGGSYLTARLSPARPFADAMILGGIGTVVSIAGAAAMWDAGPAWYSLAIIAIALPCAWLGARLQQARALSKR